MNLKLPNHKPNRKLNRYLGFPPAKRANPIRLVMNSRDPSEAHTEDRTSTIAWVYEVVSVIPFGYSNVLSFAVRLSFAIP